MSLRDFVLNAFVRRSLRGWREIRMTWREVLGTAIFLALLGYAIALLYWSGIDNHCLWNHLGSRCENGGGR